MDYEFKVGDKVKYVWPNCPELDRNAIYEIARIEKHEKSCRLVGRDKYRPRLENLVLVEQKYQVWDRILYHGTGNRFFTQNMKWKYFTIQKMFTSLCDLVDDNWRTRPWIYLCNISPVNSTQETKIPTQFKKWDKVRYIWVYNTHPELDILTIKKCIGNFIDVEETSARHPCISNIQLVHQTNSVATELPTPDVEILRPFKSIMKKMMTNTETNVRNLLRDRYFKKEWDKVLTLIETSEATMAKLHKFEKAIRNITNTVETFISNIESEVTYNNKSAVATQVAELNKFLADNVDTAEMKALMTSMNKTLLSK